MMRHHIAFLVAVSATSLMNQPTSGEDYNYAGYARVVPIPPQAGGVTEYPPGILVFGDTFYVAGGPVRLWFDVEVGGWAPLKMNTVQVGIDSSAFDNGVGAPIETASNVACSGNPVCTDTIGPGSECLDWAQRCNAFYVDPNRTSQPYYTIRAASHFSLLAGWTMLPGYVAPPDTGVPYLAGTLAIDVPAGAGGVYTIGIDQTEDRTSRSFAVASNDIGYRFANLASAKIVVGGSCCSLYECVEDPIGWPECVMAGGGWPVSTCLGDCNANGIDDACEGGPDCNGNGVLDECDMAAGAPDCNSNGVLDVCDIASGTVPDCDDNHVPDLCDVGAGAPDCNFNAVPDYCEMATGDCDGNGVLDVCDELGANDCNHNAASDACELARYPGLDCNGNGVIDSCDIAGGFSPDADGNCIPDECGGSVTALAENSGPGKSRFISFVPLGSGCPTTIEVKFVSLTPRGVGMKFSSFFGKTQYLGKPRLVWEDQAHTSMFLAAALQCTPYVFEMPQTGPLHVYGAGIMPESAYDVRQLCGAPGDQSCTTSPLTVTTTVWGDVASPYAGEAGAQPDFRDIADIVVKFQAVGGPPRVAAELAPNVFDLSLDVDFKDIAACVTSFMDQAYPLDGPTACP